MKKYAILMNSDDNYFIGMKVTIFSFLKHNTWFKNEGEIIILYNKLLCNLSKDNRNVLKKLFLKEVNIIFKNIDENDYKKAMEDTNGTRNSHIIILETFNDMGYERVVYIDSDMLIIEDIKSIFLLKEDIGVVLDNHYRDIEKSEIIKNNFFLDHILNKRLSIDRKIKNILSKFIKASILNYTLKVYRKLLQIKYKFSLKNVKKENFNLENKRFEDYEFNTGLLSIGKRLQNKKYRIDILKKSYKKNLIYSFGDQLVLNYYFYKYYENNILLLPAKFNALKSRYDDVRFNSFIKEKPKIIHYVGKKPWMKDENEIIQIGGVSYYSSFQKINSIWKNYYNELKIYEQKNTNNIS